MCIRDRRIPKHMKHLSRRIRDMKTKFRKKQEHNISRAKKDVYKRQPMTSYHEYNKIDKAYVLISKMQEGQNIALITDAGTPGISDPGEELAAMCYEAGIEVTSLPGPAACITALTLSGLPTRRFAFEAFLPADKKERKLILEELKNETRTIMLYEAPHRLVRTLEELKETLGNRRMTLCLSLIHI